MNEVHSTEVCVEHTTVSVRLEMPEPLHAAVRLSAYEASGQSKVSMATWCLEVLRKATEKNGTAHFIKQWREVSGELLSDPRSY